MTDIRAAASTDSAASPPPPDPSPVGRKVDLRAAAAAPLAQRLSPKYLEEYAVLPLAVSDGVLWVAAGAPIEPALLDELAGVYAVRRVVAVDVPAGEIHAAVISAQAGAAPESAVADLRGADLEILSPDEDGALDDLRSLANQAPVIKLVNVLILEALRARASDIHLESTPDGLRVRYRIDGVLHETSRSPREYQAAVISRVKIMASLNIAERRLAQDGRIRLRLSDRELDLRVSIIPGLHGENVVLRILDRVAGVRDLAELGMSLRVLAAFERLIQSPHGIMLVTGPTGSGKTTTLYGALRRINDPGVKIVTVEDPIEYTVDGVTQIAVNTKTGLTFAASLRSILRHDPDVIMVGEMRDPETAEIAIQAALTGHLVFSTLHTNDAPGGITRLVDMGVEPFLVSATVHAILAQRLVRLVCTACAEAYNPPADVIARAMPRDTPALHPLPSTQFFRGRGCDACAGTGYRGRSGVYELMVLSDEVRRLVAAHAPLDEIRACAHAEGTVPLRTACWDAACAGLTTLEELLRVTADEVAV
jgi:general secretion pathway protein E